MAFNCSVLSDASSALRLLIICLEFLEDNKRLCVSTGLVPLFPWPCPPVTQPLYSIRGKWHWIANNISVLRFAASLRGICHFSKTWISLLTTRCSIEHTLSYKLSADSGLVTAHYPTEGDHLSLSAKAVDTKRIEDKFSSEWMIEKCNNVCEGLSVGVGGTLLVLVHMQTLVGAHACTWSNETCLGASTITLQDFSSLFNGVVSVSLEIRWTVM